MDPRKAYQTQTAPAPTHHDPKPLKAQLLYKQLHPTQYAILCAFSEGNSRGTLWKMGLQQIAHLTGLSRKTVQRHLRGWTRRDGTRAPGMVELGWLQILDPHDWKLHLPTRFALHLDAIPNRVTRFPDRKPITYGEALAEIETAAEKQVIEWTDTHLSTIREIARRLRDLPTKPAYKKASADARYAWTLNLLRAAGMPPAIARAILDPSMQKSWNLLREDDESQRTLDL